jgi:hypothetical protein
LHPDLASFIFEGFPFVLEDPHAFSTISLPHIPGPTMKQNGLLDHIDTMVVAVKP